MGEEKGIKELLEDIKQQNEVLLNKENNFKLPWKTKLSKNKAKRGWSIIQILRNNGNIEIIKAPIENGTAKVDGFPRIATIEYKMSYNGMPWLIIPEWSMKPFSPVDNYEESIKEKMNMAGRRLVLSTLKAEAIQTKKPFGNMWVIIALIAAAGLLYYLWQGGKLF